MDNKRYPAKWTDADFNSLSWHDNYVHAIQVRNPEDGDEYDLILDIDHILEWIKGPNARLEFVVAPATLIFHIVEKLTIDIRLAYKEDLIINEIHRTDVSKGIGSQSPVYKSTVGKLTFSRSRQERATSLLRRRDSSNN